MNIHRLAACAALLPALSGHPAAHAAAPALPATLAGTWGTADSLFDGATEQLHIYLAPDGYGMLAGSSRPAKRADGSDDGKPGPRAIIGFPVTAAWDGVTLTLQAYMPAGDKAMTATGLRLACRYDSDGPALACTRPGGGIVPDGSEGALRHHSDTVPADAARIIEGTRHMAIQEAPAAGVR